MGENDGGRTLKRRLPGAIGSFKGSGEQRRKERCSGVTKMTSVWATKVNIRGNKIQLKKIVKFAMKNDFTITKLVKHYCCSPDYSLKCSAVTLF